ncbi:MAG: hypothetical protein EA403_01765 [Spirochaetaceae bacterium]|nr:MAG: hypothetical protein EA403_01765 [Spirochaetaceae bacterium]
MPALTERFIAVPVAVHPFSQDDAVVHDRLSGRRVALDRPTVEALINSASLATLADHTRELERRGYQTFEGNSVEKTLRHLVELNLLIAESEVRRRIATTPLHDQPLAKPLVTVVTHGRTQNASRLASIFHKLPEPRPQRVMMFDDSVPIAAADVSALCSVIRVSTHSRVRSFLSFALGPDSTLGPATGANRNRCLLSTAGNRILSLDDDVHLSDINDALAAAAESISLSAVATHSIEVMGHPSAENGLMGASGAGVLQSIDSVVGHSPQQVLAQSEHIDLSLLTSDMLGRLLDMDARISLLQFSLVGDHGSEHSRFLLGDPGVAESVRSNPAAYSAAKGTRLYSRHLARNVITTSDTWMAYAGGIDNSRLCPPFFPFGRRQDLLFSTMQAGHDRPHLRFHSRLQVVHSPDPPRVAVPESLCRVEYGVCDLVRLIARSRVPIAENLAESEHLRLMGNHLLATGELSVRAFRVAIRELLLSDVERQLADAHANLARGANFCDEWHRDVEALIANLEAEFASETITPPIEYRRAGFTTEAAFLSEFQRHLQLYGELVYHWPEIWEAARELREAGKLDFSVI